MELKGGEICRQWTEIQRYWWPHVFSGNSSSSLWTKIEVLCYEPDISKCHHNSSHYCDVCTAWRIGYDLSLFFRNFDNTYGGKLALRSISPNRRTVELDPVFSFYIKMLDWSARPLHIFIGNFINQLFSNCSVSDRTFSLKNTDNFHKNLKKSTIKLSNC